jgi:hypothetical protein
MALATGRNELKIPPKMLTGDLKILFLVTALAPETRGRLLVDHDGVVGLLSVLTSVFSGPVLTDEDADLAGEVLKVIFNATLHMDETVENRDESNLKDVCQCLNNLLAVHVSSEKRDALTT